MVVLFLVFWGPSILFSTVFVQFTFLQTVQKGSLFSTPSLVFVLCGLVNDGHSDQCEVVPHCSSDLNSSNNEWCGASFRVKASHPYIFFGEMSVWVFCPFFWLGCLFFCCWVVCIFWSLGLFQLHHLQIFSPLCGLSFRCLFFFFLVVFCFFS